MNSTEHHPLTKPGSARALSSSTSSSSSPRSSSSASDITRPTLKRLTAEQQQQTQHHQPSSNQIWLTKQQKQKGKQQQEELEPSTPLAHNPNRIKGDRDVLIHKLQKNNSLQGIALSYGISLPALRKANGMWPNDPLTIKSSLRIPLGLCNLPPSKKIEIEQDTGKVLVWEHHHQSTHGSNQSCSSSSTSSTSTIITSRSSFDHRRGTGGGGGDYELDSSSTHPQLTTYGQIGELAPISNDGSPPSSPPHHTRPTIISLEKVPDNQLGFFTTSKTNEEQQLIPSSSSSTHINPRTSQPTRRTNSTGFRADPSNLRQRNQITQSDKTVTISPSPIDDDLLNHPQISPDTTKKLQSSQSDLFRIPKISHPRSREDSQDMNSDPSTSTTMIGGGGGGGSKWTTVRPGKPPPLNRQLKFLEDTTTKQTNKIGTVMSSVIEGFFRTPSSKTTSTSTGSNRSRRRSVTDPIHRSSIDTNRGGTHTPSMTLNPVNYHLDQHSRDADNQLVLDHAAGSGDGCNGSIWNVWNHFFVPHSLPSRPHALINNDDHHDLTLNRPSHPE
ncbi:hypothetical protein MJO29_012118 [Puccinia striiformis f. sp. tritici]|nr:hypothetical protein Pst134EA_022811 [Puccinia striiformis f. sp. tritici]KAH9455341.1 hypothetical protein Pst134EA_022811 [Puccinia striiformis f. sp. tritici]KAI7945730.1 hypothetical protein MJO29_012118 [Puccinia striiformis f. sp. tritici]KAI9612287.1 hypothetical protein KEM48_004303 [Puccinia striiformis f. sp. tritici PST-130]